jgi:aspartate carbamoyltransferase regulatory subunit
MKKNNKIQKSKTNSQSQLKCLTVSAIKEGTVIDHIPAELTLKVMEILKLNDSKEIVSVAFNLDSKSIGKKGLIKIGGKILNKKEIDKIALIAPNSTMNIIQDYKVKEKTKIDIPNEIVGVAKCINPKCITNNERVETKFIVEVKNPLRVRCTYCERVMNKNDLQIK